MKGEKLWDINLKNGDRVRLISNDYTIMFGYAGIVEENNTSVPYINFGDGDMYAIHEKDLELIEEQTVNKNCTIEEYQNKEIERLNIELQNKQSRIDWLEGNLEAYKEFLGLGGINK